MIASRSMSFALGSRMIFEVGVIAAVAVGRRCRWVPRRRTPAENGS